MEIWNGRINRAKWIQINKVEKIQRAENLMRKSHVQNNEVKKMKFAENDVTYLEK